MSKLLSSTRLRRCAVDLRGLDPDDEPGLLPVIAWPQPPCGAAWAPEAPPLPSPLPAPVDPPQAASLARDALLSTAEAAALFGRTPRTLHRWRQRGLLRTVPVGRSQFYVAADIDALVAGRLSDIILRAATPSQSSAS